MAPVPPRSVIGLEQEYAVVLEGVPAAEQPHPMHLSNALVRAYRDCTASPMVGFDYSSEAPLRDQWGFELDRESADADLLTDEAPMANRMLTNGARYYVDHAHPEYSGPEVRSAADAARWDRAGDVVLQASADAVHARTGQRIRVYKNNTDGKGQSYGTHENYLVPRSVPFDDIVRDFRGFLASRGVLVGAGRVGVGRHGETPGFQLTQRADFFEREVGLETTIRRPLVNTRDEPHANPRRWRRLHVITGDANMSQWACWLKVGTAALALAAVERGLAPSWHPVDPVAAMHTWSHDPTLKAGVPVGRSRQATALDVQTAWWQACSAVVAADDPLGGEGRQIVDAWGETLDVLGSHPSEARDRLDWVAKLVLLEGLRSRDGLAWDNPRLAALDVQYSDVDPTRGIALKLEAAGRLRTVAPPSQVTEAVTTPPSGGRAQLRGLLLSRCGERVASMGWDSVVLIDDEQRHVTLPLGDPTRSVPRTVLEAVESGSPERIRATLMA